MGDLVRVRVEDITFIPEDIKIIMRHNKTNVFNEGSVCTVVEKGRAFNVRGFLEAYLKRMCLVRGCCVFPKNLVKGSKAVPVAYPVMYRGFEDLKLRIKAARLWKLAAVDTYCQEDVPGPVLSQALANSWD